MSKKHSVPEEEMAVLQPEPQMDAEDLGPEAGLAADEPVADAAGDLARLEQEKEEINQRYLRLRADLENIRRRAREEQSESRQKATEEIVLQFLPVFDNLERAVNAPGETENWRKGVEMVLRQFQGVMDSLGVKAIPAVGEIFDPRYHEAMLQEPAEVTENTILGELQRGYLLGERVIRPSMVKVARPVE